jgi:glutathione synthase/RimK-type ligase-like ATP-grasp enzyme
MKNIILLTDYRGVFESKHFDKPSGSGMDKNLLEQHFAEEGFDMEVITFADVDFRKANYKDRFMLYTSSEDNGYYYKSYIEDIVYALDQQGAILIPHYKFLRANNNKVFMEILRDLSPFSRIKNIRSHHFGTLEDLRSRIGDFGGEQVIKTAEGAKSRGVSLGKNHAGILKNAEKVSRTKSLYLDFKEVVRTYLYKGYPKQSKHRRKFIIQNFFAGLENDYKVLAYDKRYYVLYRATRDNDFRASGSGKFAFREDLPPGMLDFARETYESFRVPFLSMDIAYNGKEFILMEFQVPYFGKTTFETAKFHFFDDGGLWKTIRETSVLEKEYAHSVAVYIRKYYPHLII